MFTKIVILIAVNILMAKYHSHLIINGKRIQHGLWAFVYLSLVVLISRNWIFILNSFFLRKFFFDVSLNFFRGLPFFYVSTKTTSIMDKLHYKIFGKNSEFYQLIYLTIFVILSCFLMLKY